MKKTAMMIAAAALACTVGATGVWAAGAGRAHGNRTCTTAQCLFTDTDGDGVCDHGYCFTDENGDGICDDRTTGGCQGGGHGCHGRACQP